LIDSGDYGILLVLSSEVNMNTEKIEMGSGNVFKDLGIPNPELEQLKSALSFEIFTLLQKRQLDRHVVAERLEIDLTQVALLEQGDGDFTVDALFNFLNRLDISIDIYLKNVPQGEAYQQLHAAG